MKKHRDKNPYFSAVAIFSLLLAALIAAAELTVRPAAKSVAEYQGRLAAASILNDAVLDELSGFEREFSDLVVVASDDRGNVSSIRTDALAAGVFKERVVKRLTSELSAPVLAENDIPAGMLTGMALFSGFGPSVPLRVMAAGAPSAEIDSYFVSGGVNQSVHRMVLTFRVDIIALLPFCAATESVSGEVLLSETVIVGEVPQIYLNR